MFSSAKKLMTFNLAKKTFLLIFVLLFSYFLFFEFIYNNDFIINYFINFLNTENGLEFLGALAFYLEIFICFLLSYIFNINVLFNQEIGATSGDQDEDDMSSDSDMSTESEIIYPNLNDSPPINVQLGNDLTITLTQEDIDTLKSDDPLVKGDYLLIRDDSNNDIRVYKEGPNGILYDEEGRETQF